MFVPVLALVLGLSAAAAVPASPASGDVGFAADAGEGVPAFGHVVLIIGVNTACSHLTATNAPCLMGTIGPQAAWLSNYYAATHWSQANYVALVTGQFTRCEQHDGGIACHQNAGNLFHQLDTAALTWKVWLEAGTAKCDTGSGGTCTSNTACPLSGFCATGNPPILFGNIEGPGGLWSPATPSAECLNNDIPAGTAASGVSTFTAGLAFGQVASFNMVIPDGCHPAASILRRLADLPGGEADGCRERDRRGCRGATMTRTAGWRARACPQTGVQRTGSLAARSRL